MPQNPVRGQNAAEFLGISVSITLAKQSSFDFAKSWVDDISMLCSSVSSKLHSDTEKRKNNQSSCSTITMESQNLKQKRFEYFFENYMVIKSRLSTKAKVESAQQTGPNKISKKSSQIPKMGY